MAWIWISIVGGIQIHQTNQRAMKDFVSLDDLNARIEGLKASDGAYKFLSSPISRYLATLLINQTFTNPKKTDAHIFSMVGLMVVIRNNSHLPPPPPHLHLSSQ